MNELSLRFVFRAVDRASRVTRRVGAALRLHGNTVTRLQGVYRRAGSALNRMTGQMSGLAAAAGIAGTGRFLLGFEQQLVRLGIQADKPAAEIRAIKDEIFALARAPKIRVDPGEILAAVEKVVEKTGDLDLARDNLENIALAIQATGAAGSDVGALVADMQQKFGLRGKDDFLTTLDALVLQGKAGAFELKNLATQGERVTAAYAATGRVGPKAVREMGALLQMAKRGTGSAEEAATAYERLLSTITIDKVKELQDRGIELFDQEKLRQGVKEFRAIPEIVKDIIRKTGGDSQKLGQVFDIRAMRALTSFAIEFKKTGGFESVDNFLALQGDGAQLITDSAKAAKTAQAAVTNLATAWKRFSEGNLLGPIKTLTRLLNSLTPATTNTIFSIGLALGGLAIAKTVLGPVLLLGSALVKLIALGPAMVSLGATLLLALKPLVPAVLAVVAVLKTLFVAMLTNPVGLFIAAVAALAIAAFLIVKHWKPIKAFFIGIWKDVAPALKFMFPVINALAAGASLIIRNWEPIKTFFTGLWDTIKGVFAKGALFILEKLQSVLSVLPAFARRKLGLGALDNAINQLRAGAGASGPRALTPGRAGSLGAAGGEQRIRNSIQLEIKSDKPVRVRGLSAGSRDTEIDVDAGLVMVGPG